MKLFVCASVEQTKGERTEKMTRRTRRTKTRTRIKKKTVSTAWNDKIMLLMTDRCAGVVSCFRPCWEREGGGDIICTGAGEVEDGLAVCARNSKRIFPQVWRMGKLRFGVELFFQAMKFKKTFIMIVVFVSVCVCG